MSETNMPAVEAGEAMLENEQQSYELAFHILPTVAEGEVQSVFESIKSDITKHAGVIFDEEKPERFELAYEIVKHQEGKNRRYTSAYFGWVRFKTTADTIAHLQETVEDRPDILRYILIKLTKTEEENPFKFHESIESFKMVTTIDEAELVAEDAVVEDVIEEVVVEEEVVKA